MSPNQLAAAVSDADRHLLATAHARQLEAVLATLPPDVAWPRAWEGDHVHGQAHVHEQAHVRAYWMQQWQQLSPVVQPVALSRLADGCTAVVGHQTVHALRGQLRHDGHPTQLYTSQEGLLQRIDANPLLKYGYATEAAPQGKTFSNRWFVKRLSLL
jgi:hypothetical protein